VSRRIRIIAGELLVEAELNETATATLIWNVLPMTGSANLWGDEIYFSVPVDSSLDESASEVVEVGQLGYWPPGRAFCIFFGLTPVSKPGEIRPASAVNVVGRVNDDPRLFKTVVAGTSVTIEKR